MRRTWFLLSSLASNKVDKMVNWNQLAKAWANSHDFSSSKVSAMTRTLPLLEDPTSVPFVCRYRTDIIQPLSTQDVHQLSEMVQTYNGLQSLRQKILEKLPHDDPKVKQRVETSISKSDLEDIYAPLKPPSKGSLEDRINKEHPQLKPLVDAFWEDCTSTPERQLKPRDAAVTLLANKIASHTTTTDALLEYVERYARVQTTKATVSTKKEEQVPAKTQKENDKKYSTYYDFSVPLQHIRDHQVLAIKRGVNQKAIKLSFDLDGERTESRIRRSLLDTGIQRKPSNIWKEAIHDAWSRLLRKRTTTRLWKDKGAKAEQKAIQVFCDNLQKALLAPPLAKPKPILALDPGFQAGIKVAVLDKNGHLLFDDALMAVKFLQNRKEAINNLVSLLQMLYSAEEEEGAKTTNKKKQLVTVALGNGHGSQEARDLIREASDSCGIPIDIQLVNEAGASVWSVTEGASREFPKEQPAAVAAVSIGRRYQNPLPELVKIPPRSLGLGMYQHDLSEKELDEKLHITSVHAVAEVGVDGNACSLEILEKIPGLTKRLCERIMEARPLKARNDLLGVTGLGPKTFENCAGFIKVDGEEPLDGTLVHPESYRLARYLLKKLKWNLNDKASIRKADLQKSKAQQTEKWGELIEEAAAKYKVSTVRVSSVIEHLVASITNPDPRLGGGGSMSIVGAASSSCSSSSAAASNIGSIDGCSLLPSHLTTSTEALQKACPLRGIVATVRNIVDFGAFVDFGAENDGLIHISKLGKVPLSSLLVGEEIGIDILSASDNGRVALALNGLNLSPDPVSRGGKPKGSNGKRSYSTASSKKPAAKRRKVTKR